MAAALIVIEISAPTVSDDALAVLVSSCTRAARGAECMLAKNVADESPSAVAIVSLQSADKIRVEVGVRQGDHDSWRTKEFSFLAADEPMDRWRAVGFAIGTLAETNPAPLPDAPTKPEAPGPPHAPVAPPPPARPARASVRPASGPRVFVGAVGVFGPGLDRGSWRIGSGLGVELAPTRLPFYFSLGGTAATRVARDDSGAAARWFDVSAGSGIAIFGPLNHSGLQLDASLLLERFDVSASRIDGVSASEYRWLFGVGAALGGRLEVATDLFLVADLQAAGLSGSTDVKVSGEPIGSSPSFRYLGSFGLRVRLR